MRKHMPTLLALAAALLSAAALPALAETTEAPAAYSRVNPNTFIVGHPASPRWKLVHANQDHPAVTVARRAQQPAPIDPNLFVVQPPATVQWLASGEAPAAITVAAVTR